MVAVAQLPYALFPVLFWAGLRFGLREVSGALFLAAMMAVAYTSLGEGPFAGGDKLEGLASLYLFLTVLGVTSLLFSAALRQREESDAAVHASEQRNRVLIERMNEGLAMLDPDSRFQYVSDRFCAITGYRREELLGRRGIDLVVPEQRAQWEAHHRLRQQGVGDSYELTLQRGTASDRDPRLPAAVVRRPQTVHGQLRSSWTSRPASGRGGVRERKQYRLLVEPDRVGADGGPRRPGRF
jgi:PAS domain-containing protein